MKTLLVCTVGGSSDPVVNAVQQNQAGFVYFLCSTGSGREASDKTIEQETEFRQKGHCPHCDKDFEMVRKFEPIAKRVGIESAIYAIIRIADPDRLEEVVAACHRVVEDARKRWPGEHYHVVANYTGGTKTMSLGLGSVALQMMWSQPKDMDWELQLNTAPGGRKDTIKVTGGDVVVKQGASLVLSDWILTQVESLEASHQYEAAVELLEGIMRRLGLGTTRHVELAAALERVRMWAAWDRFDYDRALEVVKRNADLKGRFFKKLKRLIRIRRILGTGEKWPTKGLDGLELVKDVIENAERRAARKRYDGAIARLYRATEMLAQMYLRMEYGIHTGDVRPEAVHDEELRRWVESQRLAPRREGETRPIQLGLYKSYELLERLGDPLGKYLEKNRKDLLGVIESRNESLFAHGVRPITNGEWGRIGPKWHQWLTGAMKAVRQGAKGPLGYQVKEP